MTSRLCLAIALIVAFLPSIADASAPTSIASQLERITPVPVASGTPIEHRLTVSCSSLEEAACINPAVVIRAPELVRLSVPTDPLIEGTTAAPGQIRIELVDLPAGAAVAVSVAMTTRNGITPDGFSWTAEAESMLDNGVGDTSSADGSIVAAADVRVLKQIERGSAVVGQTSRYNLYLCSDGDPTQGRVWLSNSVLTDPIPANTVFVGASDGGAYDPSTRTVSWTFGQSADGSCRTDRAPDAWVDLSFPAAHFDPTSEVTNTAMVDGRAIGAPDVPVAASGSVTHGFFSGVFEGQVAKLFRSPLPCGSRYCIYPGEYVDDSAGEYEGSFSLRILNRGSVPAEFELVDSITCGTAVVANTVAFEEPGTVCTDPLFIAEALRFDDNEIAGALSRGWRPEYTTDLGATGTFEPSAFDARLLVADVPFGHTIGEVRIPRDRDLIVLPGAAATVELLGRALDQFPAAAEGRILYNGLRAVVDDGTQIQTFDERGAWYLRDRANLINNRFLNSAAGNPNFNGFLGNWSHQDVTIVDTFLLPPGLEYWAHRYPSNTTVERLPDWNGTGRELVRIRFEEGTEFDALSKASVRLSVFGLNQLPAGGGLIERRTFIDGEPLDLCSTSNQDGVGGSPSGVDDLDYDGDGDTSESFCYDAALARPRFAPSEQLRISTVTTGSNGPARSPSVTDISGSGDSVDLTIEVQNSGTNDLTNTIVYNMLPRQADTGVSADLVDVPRGSQFAALLASPATGVASASVAYSTSVNPCRPEVGVVDNCVDDWNATPPADLSLVTAFRVEIPGTLTSGAIVPIDFTLSTPSNLDPGDAAFNAVAGRATAPSGDLLPTEPPKAGFAVPATDLSLDLEIGELEALQVGAANRVTVAVQHDTSATIGADGALTYNGPVSASRNVEVVVEVDEDLEIIAGSSNSAAFDPSTGTWTVGNIDVNESRTISFDVRSANPGTFQVRAQVAANDVLDIDSSSGNCDEATEDDCAQVTSTWEPTVLRFTKAVETARGSDDFTDANAGSVDYGRYVPGEPVLYRFEIENAGPGLVENVSISDPLIDAYCPLDNILDTDVDDFLAPGETLSVLCDFPLGFVEGVHVNTAIATFELGSGLLVDRTDTAQIDVVPPVIPTPEIDLDYRVDQVNADRPESAAIVGVGEVITRSYTATNTGSVDLVGLSLSDDGSTVPIVPASCTRTDSRPLSDPLPPDESVTCTVDDVGAAGLVARISTVTAVAGDGSGRPTESQDPAFTFAAVPGVEVELAVRDEADGIFIDADGDDARAGSYIAGETAEWRVTITNSGDTELTGVEGIVPGLPGCSLTAATLGIGASALTRCETTAVTDVTYTAEASTNEGPSAADPATIVVTPRHVLTGTVWVDANGDGLIGPDEQRVEGVAVTLTRSFVLLGETRSDGDGTYSFGSLGADDYQVTFEVPDRYSLPAVSSRSVSENVSIVSADVVINLPVQLALVPEPTVPDPDRRRSDQPLPATGRNSQFPVATGLLLCTSGLVLVAASRRRLGGATR